MFVNRTQELAFLDRIAARQHPGRAHMVLLYGRRRVGKTGLLLHWTARCGIPITYWTAEKELAAVQRRKLYAALAGLPVHLAPLFESWMEVWQAAATLLGDQRHIVILDELPYAAEADSAMLSALQHAWDHLFQQRATLFMLCGSQVRVMESLLYQQSPLFGRMSGQWHLQPLPFATLQAFFPTWSDDERIAAYALVGGIPAYLSWLDRTRTLTANIREIVLDPGSMFGAEPLFLLYDEVREPQTYLTVLKAIGAGAHTLDAIANASLIGKDHLSTYLARLQELRLVERRLPITIPPAARRLSRRGRYHLSDAYFRFYFRFLAPYHDTVTFAPEVVMAQIQHHLRAFVGQTAFEDLARQWVVQQSRTGRLPIVPEHVGSHWSRRVQIDVVAINWSQRAILLGECKWGTELVSKQVVRELIETKTPLVRAELPQQGAGWQIAYAVFARAGLTPAARTELETHAGLAIDLPTLVAGLAEDVAVER